MAAQAGVVRTVNGVRLHMVEAGPQDGPVVLLLHGFPEFWYGWRRQIGPLARAGFRVIALDQRGYNLSDKPRGVGAYALDRLADDVIGLADALGQERLRIVGHDWGGIVAWWTAMRHPGRVERLAGLNAPHPSVMGRYVLRHPMQAVQSAYILFFQLPWLPEALSRAGGFGPLRRALAGTARPGAFTPEDLRAYEAAWAQPGALTAMLDWYRALLRRRRAAQEPRVRAPALILWGVQDGFLQEGLAEASLALCDRGRLLRLDATHWLQHERAAEVNAALIEFLRDEVG